MIFFLGGNLRVINEMGAVGVPRGEGSAIKLSY